MMRTSSTGPSVLINDMELLHAGLGVLIAHYLACDDDAARFALASTAIRCDWSALRCSAMSRS